MFQFEESTIRLMVFVSVLTIMAILEAAFPRKNRTQGRKTRWLTNFGLIIIDSFAIKLMGGITALSVAAIAASKGWGVLSFVQLPLLAEIVIAVIILDLSVYMQHVISHKIPILWRLHRVHHADRDIDVTTGFRFHPIEIILSMLYKCAVVVVVGPSVIAVFLFEIILNASAMFNHSNIRLPLWLDKVMRGIIVTPDMHRVHHSTLTYETDSNYGFCLSVWDRCFSTYIDQPKAGHEMMVIGLKKYQDENPSFMTWCLKLPFFK